MFYSTRKEVLSLPWGRRWLSQRAALGFTDTQPPGSHLVFHTVCLSGCGASELEASPVALKRCQVFGAEGAPEDVGQPIPRSNGAEESRRSPLAPIFQVKKLRAHGCPGAELPEHRAQPASSTPGCRLGCPDAGPARLPRGARRTNSPQKPRGAQALSQAVRPGSAARVRDRLRASACASPALSPTPDRDDKRLPPFGNEKISSLQAGAWSGAGIIGETIRRWRGEWEPQGRASPESGVVRKWRETAGSEETKRPRAGRIPPRRAGPVRSGQSRESAEPGPAQGEDAPAAQESAPRPDSSEGPTSGSTSLRRWRSRARNKRWGTLLPPAAGRPTRPPPGAGPGPVAASH